jgi:hypothetical protein
MRYSRTFDFLMKHTSTLMVRLIKKMCDFGCQNPRVIHEKVHHAQRITVWFAISSHGLLGPVFFEEAVNSDGYLSMLHNTFVPHFLAIGLPLQTQWFMQEGARPHIANVTLSTHVSSQTDFLIVPHVDRTWP